MYSIYYLYFLHIWAKSAEEKELTSEKQWKSKMAAVEWYL